MELKYQARKIPGVLLAPLFDRQGAAWQSHHVTNPAAFRLPGEKRVLLGYRAGGDRDHYIIGETDVFSSSLGMCVLSDDGAQVRYRFPYPILWIDRTASLPQTPAEYPGYLKAHGDDIAVMHDFRIYPHGDAVYILYHDGSILSAFDRICRMPLEMFRAKIDASIALMETGVTETAWREIWRHGDFEPLGADEAHHLFAAGKTGFPMKTDVTYFVTDEGMQMLRRPLPEISRLAAPELVGRMTPDGFDDLGVLEMCVRPGKWDNSHIGPNAMSTPAMIGDVPVYIDIWHGVHNGAFGKEDEPFRWDMYYSPFFSIRDARSGDVLYWGEEPIIDPDDGVWAEYTRHGRWIQALAHTYILFTGGQVPMTEGQTGLDDPFTFYAGAGDTAIVRGEFTIRSLTPPEVISDILHRKAHADASVNMTLLTAAFPEKIAGWYWQIGQNKEKRCLFIRRCLGNPDAPIDQAQKDILCRPGYFDADCITWDGTISKTGSGWAIPYRGVRWDEADGQPRTQIAFGLLLLDEENPERLLYRPEQPMGDMHILPGHVSGEEVPCPAVQELMPLVPEPVIRELRHMKKLIATGEHWRSHHTIWLEERAKHAGELA